MYIYSNPDREKEPHALPDIEVFYADEWQCQEWKENGLGEEAGFFDDVEAEYKPGWYYAFGFIGCLWDSDPIGPFETEEEAIAAAQEGDY